MGVRVGHLTDDQTAGGRVAAAVADEHVVQLPPQAEGAGEMEPGEHGGLPGGLRYRDVHVRRSGNRVGGVVPDVDPAGAAVHADVDVADLALGADVVGVEADGRVGVRAEVGCGRGQGGVPGWPGADGVVDDGQVAGAAGPVLIGRVVEAPPG